MKSKKAFCSWSGGKDSCLALHRAIENEVEVTHLLTMFDETGERSRSHAVSLEVMRAQADALGLKLIAPSASWQDYESVFVAELKSLKEENCETAIFGDIDLEPHREWEEKVCRQAEIKAHLPLWNENRLRLVDEFLNLGFRAVVICVNEKFLDKSFCGREFNQEFIADLPENVDACGENGEFHTFVYDGTKLFQKPVKIAVDEIYQIEQPFSGGDISKFAYARLKLK